MLFQKKSLTAQEQKYLAPLSLAEKKLKYLQSYVKGLVPDNIYDLYWKPILDVVPSTSSSNSDVDDEPFPFLAVYYDKYVSICHLFAYVIIKLIYNICFISIY